MNSQMVYQFKLPPAVNKCSVFPFFERIYFISDNCSWKRWNLSVILDYITLKTDDVELLKKIHLLTICISVFERLIQLTRLLIG